MTRLLPSSNRADCCCGAELSSPSIGREVTSHDERRTVISAADQAGARGRGRSLLERHFCRGPRGHSTLQVPVGAAGAVPPPAVLPLATLGCQQ